MTDTPASKPLQVYLSESERAALEALRRRMGERSLADTVRALIRQGGGERQLEPVAPGPKLQPGRSKTTLAPGARYSVHVGPPLQAAPGSRLKGKG